MNEELTTRIRARDEVLKDWGNELASFAIERSLNNNVPIFTIPSSESVIESSAGYPLTYFMDFALLFNYPKWMKENLGKAWGEHIYDIEGKYPILFGSMIAPLWRDQMPAWATWAFLQKKSKEDFEDFYDKFPLFVSDSNGTISNPMAFISEDSRKIFQENIKGKNGKIICPKFISPQVSALAISMVEPAVVGFMRDKIKRHGTKRIVECATIKDGDKVTLVTPVFDTHTKLPSSFYPVFGEDFERDCEFLLPVAIVNGVEVKKSVIVEDVIDLNIKIPKDKEIVDYTPGLRIMARDFGDGKKVACIVDVTTTGRTLERTILNLKNYGVNPSMCLGMIGFERIWRETAGCKMRFFEGGGTFTCTLITERELFESAIENWSELAQRIAIETVIRDEIGKIRNNIGAIEKANKMFKEYLVNYPFDNIKKLKELRNIANERWKRFESKHTLEVIK